VTGTSANHNKSPAAAGLLFAGKGFLIVGAAPVLGESRGFQPRSLVDKPELDRGWKAAPTKTTMVQTFTFS
jgi:hypothetical protein